MCAAKGNVRFTPNSDRESRHPQTVMSALSPKADMCSALADVCFGPIADIRGRLLDHFVGDIYEALRNFQAKCLGSLEVDKKLKFGWPFNRHFGRVGTLQNLVDKSCLSPIEISKARSIGGQSASNYKFAEEKRTPENGHVRFTPKSGHVRCSSACPLWAKSGHQRLFDHLVSATKHRGRHDIPSALATLRLITRSYLVGV